MDKSTNVHQKVAATFVSTYFNALAEGKTAEVAQMYTATAKVNHFNVDGAASLSAYAKGAKVAITEVEPRLVNNSTLKVTVKGSITINGSAKKDFVQEVELIHQATSASQLSFGVTSDVLRTVTAPPPPPKMKFDDWAADTPTLNAQAAESEVVPDIELVTAKAATPQVTPKVAPAPAPAAPAPVVEEKKVEEKEEAVVEKKEEAKPAPVAEAPKGWANIVRSQTQGTKAVVSVVDPTKKVAEKKEEKKAEKKEEAVVEEKKEKDEEKKERRSAKNPTPIFYDVFVKGFPEGVTDADVPVALNLKVAVANTKIDAKVDKNGVRRVFVYVKLSTEDLTKQGITREEAIATIISTNKNAKFNNARLNVEEVKERFNSESAATAAPKNSNKK